MRLEGLSRPARRLRPHLPLQGFRQAFPYYTPLPEVLRHRPDQLQPPSADLVHLARGRRQKLFRRRLGLPWQHQQKLPAPARSQQNPRQPKLRQQRPRQHLAQQGDPLRPPHQYARLLGRQHELFYTQQFPGQQNLYRHAVKDTLRKGLVYHKPRDRLHFTAIG